MELAEFQKLERGDFITINRLPEEIIENFAEYNGLNLELAKEIFESGEVFRIDYISRVGGYLDFYYDNHYITILSQHVQPAKTKQKTLKDHNHPLTTMFTLVIPK